MKFKAAIVSLLSAMLIVGIVTASLLVTEAKKQTIIMLEMADTTKNQEENTLAIAESIKIQEDELKKQTDIALKTADLISIHADMKAAEITWNNFEKENGHYPSENSGYTAGFRREETRKIREALGLDELRDLFIVGKYYPQD